MSTHSSKDLAYLIENQRSYYPYLTIDEIMYFNTLYSNLPSISKIIILSIENKEKKHKLKIFKNENLTGKNFKGKNLTDANFENAILHKTTFDYHKISGANFKNTKCLTNKQRQRLTNHGAIKVPERLTDEEFAKEIEEAEKTWLRSLLKLLKKNFNKL